MATTTGTNATTGKRWLNIRFALGDAQMTATIERAARYIHGLRGPAAPAWVTLSAEDKLALINAYVSKHVTDCASAQLREDKRDAADAEAAAEIDSQGQPTDS